MAGESWSHDRPIGSQLANTAAPFHPVQSMRLYSCCPIHLSSRSQRGGRSTGCSTHSHSRRKFPKPASYPASRDRIFFACLPNASPTWSFIQHCRTRTCGTLATRVLVYVKAAGHLQSTFSDSQSRFIAHARRLRLSFSHPCCQAGRHSSCFQASKAPCPAPS